MSCGYRGVPLQNHAKNGGIRFEQAPLTCLLRVPGKQAFAPTLGGFAHRASMSVAVPRRRAVITAPFGVKYRSFHGMAAADPSCRPRGRHDAVSVPVGRCVHQLVLLPVGWSCSRPNPVWDDPSRRHNPAVPIGAGSPVNRPHPPPHLPLDARHGAVPRPAASRQGHPGIPAPRSSGCDRCRSVG